MDGPGMWNLFSRLSCSSQAASRPPTRFGYQKLTTCLQRYNFKFRQIQFTIGTNTIYNSNYNPVQQPVILLTDLEYQKAHHMLPASLRSPHALAIFYLSESLVKTVVLAGAGHKISLTLAAFQLNMSPCVSRDYG